ncbi:unnamed protein product [Bemisia tabaci]|uniref:Intraflagellar transport 20 n=1 Tax=Bemisia tabaci TaxID=7038 RepID=A0A9P0AMA0_BEMTA|nr:unnamed protein product [Bemisia tabaci]
MEGIVFDELNKIHILDPQIFDKTLQLKNEAGQFLDAVTSFQKTVDDLIGAAEKLGEDVEKEKLKAIGSRNYIQSLSKQRETLQSELQSLIIEKSLEIERLRIEHESLLRTQVEQQEVLDALELNA